MYEMYNKEKDEGNYWGEGERGLCPKRGVGKMKALGGKSKM